MVVGHLNSKIHQRPIGVIAKVTIKIYSNAILNYGTKMGIKDIMKMYKDKNN